MSLILVKPPAVLVDAHGRALTGERNQGRSKRCQNCQHFVSGEVVVTHYGVRTQVGRVNSGHPKNCRQGCEYCKFDPWVATGLVGICKGGYSQGEFVHMAYFCERWSAAPHMKPEDGPDELPAEGKERVDGVDAP